MEYKVKEQEKQIFLREQEIHRLSLMYKGGQNFDNVKINYDRQSSEDTINKHVK